MRWTWSGVESYCCSTVQCVQYSTVQYSTTQLSTIQYVPSSPLSRSKNSSTTKISRALDLAVCMLSGPLLVLVLVEGKEEEEEEEEEEGATKGLPLPLPLPLLLLLFDKGAPEVQ